MRSRLTLVQYRQAVRLSMIEQSSLGEAQIDALLEKYRDHTLDGHENNMMVQRLAEILLDGETSNELPIVAGNSEC